MKKVYYLLLFVVVSLFFSCGDKEPQNNLSGFDQEVLKTWGEKIMIPAYQNYQNKVVVMHQAAISFKENPNEQTFSELKNQWEAAYIAYQKTMLFDIEIAFSQSYLGMSNTYPTVPTSSEGNTIYNIQANIDLIAEGNASAVHLTPTTVEARQAYQGFPALDYLLFAEGKNVEYYVNNPAAATYVVMLTEALKNNIDQIVTYWQSNINKYVADSDQSINGSYVRTLNAFVRVYEKNIRSFKVGLAAGAIKAQNGIPQPQIIEAYYNEELSKELLKTALQSSQDFFNGKYFDGSGSGTSLKHILEKIGKGDLATSINNQYDLMYAEIESLPQSLKQTAANDTPKMKKLYDVIQVNVAKFKTEMLAALNAQVNYADTDGD